jgi:hypothetical protein
MGSLAEVGAKRRLATRKAMSAIHHTSQNSNNAEFVGSPRLWPRPARRYFRKRAGSTRSACSSRAGYLAIGSVLGPLHIRAPMAGR